jgi:hypothetical protein
MGDGEDVNRGIVLALAWPLRAANLDAGVLGIQDVAGGCVDCLMLREGVMLVVGGLIMLQVDWK